MTKNKDISINPAKGISIVIKNDFLQPTPIAKKKRKYKRKVNTNILKMPTMPSFIPAGDVSYIKPQYSTSSLNRNRIYPGTPQSLPQLPPPPQLPQVMPPPSPSLSPSDFSLIRILLCVSLPPSRSRSCYPAISQSLAASWRGEFR